MAKGQGRSSGQGVKLLYIRDYLYHYATKEHPKNAKAICDYLMTKGIDASPKTIYNDILRLQIDFGVPVETVVHGDSLSASIAAASVLAKVTRDDYMLEMANTYPGYDFEIHKGYGTKAHYAALTELGASPIHRMTFLKKFYGEK